jgi:hypothetical protein
VASACAAYANARCARYHECVPFSFGVTYASLADCETSTEQYCPFELAAPGSSRTATVLSACTAGTLTQTCGEWLTALPADCRVPGANATGSACEYDSQCSSTYCQRRDRGWCGNCAPRTQLGAQCSPRESACATGLKCARSCADPADCPKIEANYHCIAPKSENEACPIGTECRNDLYCVNGRCGQGLALGAACEIGLCVGELQCLSDPNGNTCRVSSYAAVGVACNLAEGHYCSANATCSDAGGQPLNGGQGTCKAAAAPGQACPNGCAAPAQCSAASVCVLPVAAATCQ